MQELCCSSITTVQNACTMRLFGVGCVVEVLFSHNGYVVPGTALYLRQLGWGTGPIGSTMYIFPG